MRRLLTCLLICLLGTLQADATSTMMTGAGSRSSAVVATNTLNPIIVSPLVFPIAGSTTMYSRFSSGDLVTNTNVNNSNTDQPQQLPGTLSGLTFTLVSQATGLAASPTNSISATVFKNGTSTGYGCLISSAATSCSCPLTGVCGASPPAVSFGDTVSVAFATTGWTTSQLYGSISLIKNAVGAEWFSSTGTINLGTLTQYFGVNSGINSSTENNSSSVMPVSGTVTGYTVKYSSTPTATSFITSNVCHNGVCGNTCAGWNGTVAVNPCSVTFTDPFVVGDTYSLQFVPTGSNNTFQRSAIAYTTTKPNQVILSTSASAAMNTVNPYSMPLRGMTAPQVSTANPMMTFGAISSNGATTVISHLAAYESASVPTRTWTFSDGSIASGAPAATALTCTNSATSTTIGGSLAWFGCTDNVDTVTIAAGAAQSWANWVTVGPATGTGSSKVSAVAVVNVGGVIVPSTYVACLLGYGMQSAPCPGGLQ